MGEISPSFPKGPSVPHSLCLTTVYRVLSRTPSPAHATTSGISELLPVSLRWRFGPDTARACVLYPASRRMVPQTMEAPENALLRGLACRISVLLALLCFPPCQSVSFCFGGCCEAPPRLMDRSNTSLSGPSKSAHYCPHPHSPPPQAGRALPHSPGQLLVTVEHGDLNTAKA